MVRYLLLYTFNRTDATSLHRLIRLQRMNPKITIVPVFGVPQTISFPIPKLPKRYRQTFNWEACRSKPLFEITKAINKSVESFRRRNELNETQRFFKKLGLNLYCDFTPIGKINQDLAIISWFKEQGKNLDFDVMVYFEYDMFTTRTIEDLYSPYLDYDAGFVGYRVSEPSWMWYDRPSGSKRSVCRWLKKIKAEPIIYRSFFPGHFLSRKVLEKLVQHQMPNAFCEMRSPSVITGLDFRVGVLDFPKIHVTIEESGILETEIKANSIFGIFHPVYGDFDF